jgi:hypothetical protein
MDSTDADLLPSIAKEKAISDPLAERLKKAVLEYRRQSGLGAGDEAAAPTPEASA